jgi:hypothetical protein
MMPRHDESFKNVPVSAAGIRQGFCGAYVWCAPLNKAAFFITTKDASIHQRLRRYRRFRRYRRYRRLHIEVTLPEAATCRT